MLWYVLPAQNEEHLFECLQLKKLTFPLEVCHPSKSLTVSFAFIEIGFIILLI